MESVIGEKILRQMLLRSTFCLMTRVFGLPVTVANGFTHNLYESSEGFDSYFVDWVVRYFLATFETGQKL